MSQEIRLDPNVTYDLEERIKNYLIKHKEQWDDDKHFIYIDCTKSPPILVFEEWKYKCPKPTALSLNIPISLTLPESVVKNLS